MTALKLTEQALDSRHKSEPRSPLSILTEFSRRAPLLFLRYADIVQEALDIKLNGQLPGRNDDLTRRQIDALTRARNARGEEIAVPGASELHPPAPVRIAILRDNIKGWGGLASVQPNVDENAFARLPEALDEGIQRLWRESRPLLLVSPTASTTSTPPADVQISLTGPDDPVTLTLVVRARTGPPPAYRPDVALIFVNQAEQCGVPEVSTVRLTTKDGMAVSRPAPRVSQDKSAGLCTEGVGALLRLSEAAMLATASSMTIEFAGREFSLSAAQLEDFRRGLGRPGGGATR